MLVFLNDQVDIAALDAQMSQTRVTLQERHKTVVQSLQTKASETQGDFIEFLTDLQTDGRIINFQPYWISNVIRVDAPHSEIQTIADQEDVYDIYYNHEIELIEPVSNQPSDIESTGMLVENGVEAVRAPEVGDLGYTGEGVLVANIDTVILI